MFNLPKPSVIAFDLDLTIYDILDIYEETLNKTREELGLKPWSKEEYKSLHHNNFITNYKAFERIFGDNKEKAFEIYYNKFHQLTIPKNCEYIGIRSLLKSIKFTFKLPIIAVTNSEQHMAKKVLTDLDLLKYFDSVTGMKKDRTPKPDKQLLEIGLKKINYNTGPDVWFIGDSDLDTKCALNANSTGIRYDSNNKITRDINAKTIIKNYSQIIEYLKEFLK